MHKTKLVLLTAAALLAITSGAEAAKVKRSSGFSMGRPASVKPVQKPAPVTNPVPGRPAASTQAAPQTAPAAAPAKQAAANAHIIGRPDPDGNGSDGVKHRKTPFIESCRAAAPEIGQLPPAVAFSSRPSFSKSCSR